jgi:hypothetical protein
VSLIAHAMLVFEFDRRRICDANGHQIGSLEWHRRGGHRSSVELGFLDPTGVAACWLRPMGGLASTPDLVFDAHKAMIGAVSPYGLRLGSQPHLEVKRNSPVDAHIRNQGSSHHNVRWEVTDRTGRHLAVIWRTSTGWLSEGTWTLEYSSDASGPLRLLVLVMPELCRRWRSSSD